MNGVEQFRDLLCGVQGRVLALQVVTSVLIGALDKTHGDEIKALLEQHLTEMPWPEDLDKTSPEFLATLAGFETAADFLKDLVAGAEDGSKPVE